MTIDKITGIIVLILHAIGAIGWTAVAFKEKKSVWIWLACAFMLLWVPIFIRWFFGDVYDLEGRRIITVSYIINRIAFVGGYACIAIAAFVAFCESKRKR